MFLVCFFSASSLPPPRIVCERLGLEPSVRWDAQAWSVALLFFEALEPELTETCHGLDDRNTRGKAVGKWMNNHFSASSAHRQT